MPTPSRPTKKSSRAATPARAPTPAPPPALRTLGDWLAHAVDRYASSQVALGQITTDAHDEALYLLLRTLRLPLDCDPSVLDRPLTPDQTSAVQRALHRRLIDRIPAAYLTREAFLGEHRFYIDERVIIPRSYFVELLPLLPQLLPSSAPPARLADVCTGSACLAILLAHTFPRARVDAFELSSDALEVARINVRAHTLTDRLHLYESDVLDALPASDPGNYDLILSNPPYEPSAHVDGQAPEFRAEPRIAHDGGPDGLVIIRKLLRQAGPLLAPHGVLLIEIGGIRKLINRTFASLKPEWLDTEDGTNCVVLFRAKNLRA